MENTDFDLSIVIVGTDEGDLVESCLRSLYSPSPSLRFETIVVDNCSKDGTLEMVKKSFPSVRVIRNNTRYPRSKNNNIGIKESRGRYILLLDPDTQVKPGSLRLLVNFMDNHPEAGICGPRLISPDGELQLSCRTFQTPLTILYRRTILGKLFPQSRILREHLMSDWDHATLREVDWVLGAAMIVSREAIREVGLMDEAYLRYVEDMDWCYRFRRMGWKVYYYPEAEVVHLYRRKSASFIFHPRTFLNINTIFHIKGIFRFFRKYYLYPLAKRVFDLLVSTIGLIVFSPVLGILALAIKIDSPGPAFFAQTRVGRFGREFKMLKFRSMCNKAEKLQSSLSHLNEVPGPVFKIRDDPRLTRMGRFLRRFSLDELPQLINILKGQMSLVGPRPPIPSEVREYTPKQMRRLQVIPGLTGLWQVSGRSDIEFDKWIDLDLEYIANQSLLLDLKILLKTIPAVISGKGAY